MRNVNLIAVNDGTGKRLRISVLSVYKDTDTIRELAAPVEKPGLQLRIFFHHFRQALADGAACDINPVNAINESLQYGRYINFYSHKVSIPIISLLIRGEIESKGAI